MSAVGPSPQARLDRLVQLVTAHQDARAAHALAIGESVLYFGDSGWLDASIDARRWRRHRDALDRLLPRYLAAFKAIHGHMPAGLP